jgi:histidine ammonia-lyase
MHSSLTASEMTALVRDALAILLLALCQSIDLRKKADPGAELGQVTRSINQTIRDQIDFLEVDRPMHGDIERINRLILRREFELS